MSCTSRKIIEPFTFTKDTLNSGDFLECGRPTVKDRKHISFTCTLPSGKDGIIRIGQGYQVSSGAWIEIEKKKACAYSYYSYTNPNKIEILPSTELGFELDGFVSICINNDYANSENFVRITSVGGTVKIPIPKFTPNNGEIFVSPLNFDITDCKLNWFCDGYSDDIWVFGDSYLGFGHDARWPYYLYKDGYTDVLLSGYPGMGTPRGLEDFKLSLEKGTPIYAVWCLGMNNGEPEKATAPNEKWLSATKEFLDICKEKGIIPILSTIPETPTVRNGLKNEWVRASGYRYIDFAHAVGADKDPEWYPGMLFSDRVHPAKNGAAALYAQC